MHDFEPHINTPYLDLWSSSSKPYSHGLDSITNETNWNKFIQAKTTMTINDKFLTHMLYLFNIFKNFMNNYSKANLKTDSMILVNTHISPNQESKHFTYLLSIMFPHYKRIHNHSQVYTTSYE